jgi:hypothetical protein
MPPIHTVKQGKYLVAVWQEGDDWAVVAVPKAAATSAALAKGPAAFPDADQVGVRGGEPFSHGDEENCDILAEFAEDCGLIPAPISG